MDAELTAAGAKFLSTPSARRATGGGEAEVVIHGISIHALREEGDDMVAGQFLFDKKDFYPRPPRGGRPILFSVRYSRKEFLSTPSARRATPHPPHPAQ